MNSTITHKDQKQLQGVVCMILLTCAVYVIFTNLMAFEGAIFQITTLIIGFIRVCAEYDGSKVGVNRDLMSRFWPLKPDDVYCFAKWV